MISVDDNDTVLQEIWYGQARMQLTSLCCLSILCLHMLRIAPQCKNFQVNRCQMRIFSREKCQMNRSPDYASLYEFYDISYVILWVQKLMHKFVKMLRFFKGSILSDWSGASMVLVLVLIFHLANSNQNSNWWFNLNLPTHAHAIN